MRQTSTSTFAFSESCTSIIGLRHDGQGLAFAPSPRMAWSQSGLIDSGVNIRRKSSTVMARPPQRSHAHKIRPRDWIFFSGRLQRGQTNLAEISSDIASPLFANSLPSAHKIHALNLVSD